MRMFRVLERRQVIAVAASLRLITRDETECSQDRHNAMRVDIFVVRTQGRTELYA